VNKDVFESLLEPAKEMLGVPVKERYSAIRGPFDGKINSIYLVTYGTGVKAKHVVFRARVSEVFRYEGIVKEKILYPILDGRLDLANTATLRSQVEEILDQKSGSLLFSTESPPAVTVPGIYYYDETKEKLPYIYTLMEYIPGISLYEYLDNVKARNVPAEDLPDAVVKKLDRIFSEAGVALGKLHDIVFTGFWSAILDIGDESKTVAWKELFMEKAKKLMAEASQYPAMEEILPALDRYFQENVDLISDDETPVLFHNDFQPQNFMIDPEKGHVTGYIDFDNWQVGVKEQDFIKINYWGTRELDPRFEQKFIDGYRSVHELEEDFQKKVNLYKMQWFILVFNFEMSKISKNELNATVDQRFPAAEKYIDEMRAILGIDASGS
jgi:aminoglycoside phosphotransferase (APT) family kinase protein